MSVVVENEPVYILHRRPYRESSFILDIFSLNYGRLSLVANGAGKSASKKSQNKAALLQTFQPLTLSWSGRSNLKTLRQVEAVSPAFVLSQEALYCAYYCNELLLFLTPESDPIPELFVVYAQSIAALRDAPERHTILRRFELTLLSAIGLIPGFENDISGMPIELDRSYLLNLEEGFFPADSSYLEHQKVQPGIAIFEGKVIRYLAQLNNDGLSGNAVDNPSSLSKEQERQAKVLLKTFVDFVLQGRELKSRTMYEQLVQQRRSLK